MEAWVAVGAGARGGAGLGQGEDSFLSWLSVLATRQRMKGHARSGEAKAKEPEHFEEAFALWGKDVWRSLRVRGINERDLQDALQEVFIVALTKWDSFRGESTRKTWILGIVNGTAANYRRKRGRAAAEPALANAGLLDGLCAPGSRCDPSRAAEQNQALELLAQLVRALPPKTQELYVLTRFDGCSLVEASRLLGVNYVTAAARVARAEREVEAAVKRLKAADEWRFK